MRTLAGVDMGGTFTDVALVHEGRLIAVKLSTTVDDQSRAVIEGVERALERAGVTPEALGHLGHGTTVATNALAGAPRSAPPGSWPPAGSGICWHWRGRRGRCCTGPALRGRRRCPS